MGALGDKIGNNGLTSPTQMRTAPLWGLVNADQSNLLHDGRAHSIASAMQQHAGQGTAAAAAFNCAFFDGLAGSGGFLEFDRKGGPRIGGQKAAGRGFFSRAPRSSWNAREARISLARARLFGMATEFDTGTEPR
jgi:hypothetical protein